jgi:hypothetical protein
VVEKDRALDDGILDRDEVLLGELLHRRHVALEREGVDGDRHHPLDAVLGVGGPLESRSRPPGREPAPVVGHDRLDVVPEALEVIRRVVIGQELRLAGDPGRDEDAGLGEDDVAGGGVELDRDRFLEPGIGPGR